MNFATGLWRESVINVHLFNPYLKRISNNDYTILDLRLGYRIQQWMVYIDANNLLDQQYKESGAVPMPGRWFTFGAKFDCLWGKAPAPKKQN